MTERRLSTRARPALLLAAGATILAGCGRIETAQEFKTITDRPIRIVATTGHVGDLARQIGGDLIDLHTLMGPGVDPHLYKASERDVERFIDADAILFNGLHLEGKLGEILERVGERRLVRAVTDMIPRALLHSPPEFEGNYDPHIWFDPSLWARTVEVVLAALSLLSPQHEATFSEHADAVQKEISELDTWAAERLGAIPDQQRILVTAHDAFGNFGAHYDIDVVGLQGISTSTEAGIRDIQRLADLLAERRVKAIFVETSVPPRTIEAVQSATRDRGWDVSIGGSLYSDALGDAGTPEGTYVGMFRANVNTITEALT